MVASERVADPAVVELGGRVREWHSSGSESVSSLSPELLLGAAPSGTNLLTGRSGRSPNTVAAAKCQQRSGKDLLANAGTRDVVKDMEIPRQALGDQKLAGTFGSLPGLAAAPLAPRGGWGGARDAVSARYRAARARPMTCPGGQFRVGRQW